jgi:hypothetical protein
VIDIHAEVDAAHVSQTRHEETGADEQHRRQCDLTADERAQGDAAVLACPTCARR